MGFYLLRIFNLSHPCKINSDRLYGYTYSVIKNCINKHNSFAVYEYLKGLIKIQSKR